jgi:hypothetical protein
MSENLRQLRHVLAELAPRALLQALELPELITERTMELPRWLGPTLSASAFRGTQAPTIQLSAVCGKQCVRA